MSDPNEILTKIILRSRWEQDALEDALPIIRSEDFSWRAFGQFLQDERLSPLASYLLRGVDWLTDPIRDQLEKASLSTTTQNLILFRELKTILSLTNSQKIKVILLKGAVLATQIYPHMAMRPMLDLDILVSPHDASDVISIIENLGYHKARQEEHPGFTLNYENEVGLIKQESILKMVEVHWNLFNSTYYQNKIPYEKLWESAESIEFNRYQTLVLDPETQFLHLCGHLSLHHAGKGWLWVHDLAEIIMHEKYHLDWTKLINDAQKFDLVLPLKVHLHTLAEIYGAIIPGELLSTLEELQPSAYEQHHFSAVGITTKTASRTFVNDVRNIPGFRDKAIFTLANIFPSSLYMKYRYKVRHPAFLPVYYVYRWYLGIAGLFTKK